MSQTESLRVAAVQLSSQHDVEENLRAVERGVEEAAELGAQLVLLPENFASMGSEAGKRGLAEEVGDLRAPLQARLSALACRRRLWLLAGGMPERSPDEARPFNTCVVFDREGQVCASYRKLHLFDVTLPDGSQLRESESTSPGREPVVVDIDGFKVGLSICYDLRFPELYRRLVDAGAELLVVPAAFTLQTGKDHWHVLLRARAIESQCWVLAAAQWGRHPGGRACYGHSLLADPWGTVVSEASDGVGVVSGAVRRAQLEQTRSLLPSLRHRRL